MPLPTAVTVTWPDLPTIFDRVVDDLVVQDADGDDRVVGELAPGDSMTNSVASSAVANVCVAPKTVAMSRLNSTGSTTTTRSAPAYRGALHGVAAHATGAEDHDGLAGPDAGRVHRRAPAGGHAAADERGDVERDVVRDRDARSTPTRPRTAEKVPSTHSPPKSSPSWWKRNVPSGNMPVPAFLPSSHRFCRPVEQ